VGCSDSCWTLRRASSLRFLKACSEETVWPRRPSELVTLVQSSLRAALRYEGEGAGKISSSVQVNWPAIGAATVSGRPSR
jgi:hypothetical protein